VETINNARLFSFQINDGGNIRYEQRTLKGDTTVKEMNESLFGNKQFTQIVYKTQNNVGIPATDLKKKIKEIN
jgi:hypothetical protein